MHVNMVNARGYGNAMYPYETAINKKYNSQPSTNHESKTISKIQPEKQEPRNIMRSIVP